MFFNFFYYWIFTRGQFHQWIYTLYWTIGTLLPTFEKLFVAQKFGVGCKTVYEIEPYTSFNLFYHLSSKVNGLMFFWRREEKDVKYWQKYLYFLLESQLLWETNVCLLDQTNFSTKLIRMHSGLASRKIQSMKVQI